MGIVLWKAFTIVGLDGWKEEEMSNGTRFSLEFLDQVFMAFKFFSSFLD